MELDAVHNAEGDKHQYPDTNVSRAIFEVEARAVFCVHARDELHATELVAASLAGMSGRLDCPFHEVVSVRELQ